MVRAQSLALSMRDAAPSIDEPSELSGSEADALLAGVEKWLKQLAGGAERK